MICLSVDSLHDHVQLTELTNMSVALEAVGLEQSVSGVDAAVRRKVLDEMAEYMLLLRCL